MININILGSCVSRDIFRYDEKKNFEINLYVARTSICSNLSNESWHIKDSDLYLESHFQKEAVIRDLNKTVIDDLIEENQVDYLIIDFIDERFRIVKQDNKYATYSNELLNSGYLKDKEFEFIDKQPIERGGFEFEGKDVELYVEEIAEKLKKAYDEDRIIIHEAYMVDSYISADDGEIRKFPEPICNDVYKKNALLKYMYESLERYLPNAKVMSFFDTTIFADEKHLWGLTPMHYTDSYYQKAVEYLYDLDGEYESVVKAISLDEFSKEDIDITLKEDCLIAVNNFDDRYREDIYFSWYINEVVENKTVNVYKSPEWVKDNLFVYRFESEKKAEYDLIAYVRNGNQRVNRLAANICCDGSSVYKVKEVYDFSTDNIKIKTNETAIKINIDFKLQDSVQYAYYIFENDFRNLIYKSNGFTDETSIKYIPSNSQSAFYFWIYIKDAYGNRSKIVTDKIKLKSRNSEFGLTLNEFNCDMTLPVDNIVLKWADDMMTGNRLYVNKGFPKPLKYKEVLDWNVVFSPSPATFQLWMQSLGMVSILTRAFLITGEKRYLYKANYFLRDWDRYDCSVKSKENNMVWHDHGSALRANSIIYFALVSDEAGELDEEKAIFLRKLIKRHCDFLTREDKYTKNHNHGIFQDQSLLYCAYFMDDNDSDKLIELALKRLQGQIEFAFNSEKVHVENSSAYHIALLYMLNTIAEFLDMKKHPLTFYVKANIKESADFLSHLNRPSGNLLNTGDSSIDGKKLKIDLNARKLGSDAYLFSATQGKEGEESENESVVFPKSGYYFYKEKSRYCSDFSKATWKMFKGGYSSRTHKHADDLSIALYSKGYDILIDTGYYNYAIGSNISDYLKSSLAHNTVIVDDKSYSTESEMSHNTSIYTYRLDEDVDIVTGYNNMYDGVSIARTVYSANDVTVIVDDIVSDDEHKYTQAFHLSDDMKVVSKSKDEILLAIADTGFYVRIRQIDEYETEELFVINGQNTLPDSKITGGYASYGQNEFNTITTLHFVKSGENARFVTAITIEDDEGNVVFSHENDSDKNKIKYTDVDYDIANNTIRIGKIKKYVGCIDCSNFNTVETTMDNSVLVIFDSEKKNNNRGERWEYEYELIDTESGLIFDKKPYSTESRCKFNINKNNFLVKAKIKKDDLLISNKVIAHYQFDNEQKKWIADNKKEFLSLHYKGQNVNMIDKDKYRFSVEFDYSFDYKIKWYIYRNGQYFSSLVSENENELLFQFEKEGEYTVSYYITTDLNEKFFFNYPVIKI